MNPDYEGLIGHLKELSAIPLVIVYGVQKEGKVELNYFYTPSYDDADATLKSDIKSAVEKTAQEL